MQKISGLATISAIVLMGIALLAAAQLPANWIYDELAVRVAFSPERASQEHIAVEQITKPSTVTFSNGERIDVGMKPAIISDIFRLVVTVPLMIGYYLLLRRYGPKWIDWHPKRDKPCRAQQFD